MSTLSIFMPGKAEAAAPAPSAEAKPAEKPRAERAARRERWITEHLAELEKLGYGNASAVEDALARACAELARAALACDPDHPAAVLKAVMGRVMDRALQYRYRRTTETEEERRFSAAEFALTRLLDNHRFVVEYREGREQGKTELEGLLDVAWTAARDAMVEGSRANLAAVEIDRADRERAESEERRAERRERDRERRQRQKKAGAPSVRFAKREGRS